MQRILTYGGLAIVILVGVAACGGDDGQGLVDTSWRVRELRAADGSMVVPEIDTVLSADFSADTLSGLSGCNSFAGSYAINGNEFSSGPLAGTRRLCEPPAVMEQESTYLASLAAADRWTVDGDTLELSKGSETVVVFQLAEPVALDGTRWRLLFYNNQREALVSVANGTTITMAFDGDMAGGSAGCNDYTAGYEAADPSLTFGPAAATTQLCPDPEGIMEQEGLFLSDLEMVATYEVTAEGNLEMFDEAGTRLLQFQPE